MKVRGVGSLNLRFHMRGANGEEKSFTVLLQNINVMDDMKFNLFSLHQVQGKQDIILKKKGVYLFDGQLVFTRDSRASYQVATRLPPDFQHEALAAPTLCVPPVVDDAFPSVGVPNAPTPTKVECLPAEALSVSTSF